MNIEQVIFSFTKNTHLSQVYSYTSSSCHVALIVFWLDVVIMVSFSNHDLPENSQSCDELDIGRDRRRHYLYLFVLYILNLYL